MARKLLTALDQMQERTIVVTITYAMQRETIQHIQREALIEQQYITQKEALPFLNVQRLMAIQHAISMSKYMVIVEPEQRYIILSKIYPMTLEEEEIQRKHIVTPTQALPLQIEREQRLTRRIFEEETRILRLYERSILMIEQQILALLESFFYTRYPIETLQALGTLLESCIKKQWYIRRIEKIEHLQKFYAQQYFYPMMEYPKTYGMIGLKVTPLTMMVLRHRNASIYATIAMQKEQLKQKTTMKTVLKQKETTKKVLKGKRRYEIVPQRENIGVTEDLTEETPVNTGKDDFGREWLFTALRYAYSIPYWIRRMLVRTYGMPENHKYAKYFGIGCIPTRRTPLGYKRQRYGKEPWTEKQKIEYLKWYKEYFGHYPAGTLYSNRYGGFKFKL